MPTCIPLLSLPMRTTVRQRLWLRCRAASVLALLCLLGVGWLSAADGGWVAPTGFQDPENKWVTESQAYDASTASYAADQCNRSGDGPWLSLAFPTSMTTDRVQIIADFGYNIVDSIAVEANIGGTWTPVYAGVVLNDDISVIEFPAITTSEFRFRFHYLVNGYYFWLYDFRAFQLPAAISAPVVATVAASSVTSTTAVLHGLLTEDGGQPCTVRFQYRAASVVDYTTTTWQGGVTSGQGSNLVLSSVQGLQSGIEYCFRIQAENSAGMVTGDELAFTPASIVPGSVEWISASGVTPSGSGDMVWTDTVRGIDDDVATSTRCYHPLWAVVASPAIEFNLPVIATDTVRLMAGCNPYIAAVTVWVQEPLTATWTQVYSGAFTDRTWLNIPLPSMDLYGKAKVVFTASTTGVGTAWELQEFQVRVPTAEEAQLPIPVFSPAGGTAVFPQTVAISCGNSAAVIHFTTDGSEPDDNSQIFTDPVMVTEPTTMRARAFRQGWLASSTATASWSVNTAPVITAITGDSVVRSRTTSFEVFATDDGGVDALTQIWSVDGPAQVTIAPNGTQDSEQAQAAFSAPGAYSCTVQVTDVWGAVTSASFDIMVEQEATRIDLPNDSTPITPGETRQLHATVFDQFDAVIEGRKLYWSADAGRISEDGLLVAGPWAMDSLQVTVVCLPVRTTRNIPVDRSQPHLLSPLYGAPAQPFDWEAWQQDPDYRKTFLQQPIARLVWMSAVPTQSLGQLAVQGVGRRPVGIGSSHEIQLSIQGVPGAPVFAVVDRPELVALLDTQGSSSSETSTISGTCGPDGVVSWWIRGLRSGEARVRVASPVSSNVGAITIQCGAE